MGGKEKMIEEGEDDISHVIDVDEEEAWLNSMTQKLYGNSSNGGDNFFIRRVPEAIRRRHEGAYDPKVVSIGPYHRDKKDLKEAEELKWQCLRDIFFRNPKSIFKNCLKEIKKLEANARRCYSEDLSHIGSNEFVEMMLLDGCFILQYFLKHLWWVIEMEKINVPIFTWIWMPPIIYHDLLLVENQLPFFILSRLFQLLFKDEIGVSSAKEFLGLFFQRSNKIPEEQPIHHLLHFLHMCIYPAKTDSSFESRFKKLKNLFPSCLCHLFSSSSQNQSQLTSPSVPQNLHSIGCFSTSWTSSQKQSQLTIPCATELKQAGVRFKKRDTRNLLDILIKKSYYLDIKFRHGVMEIPSFVIDQHSDSFFRNLITFEQSCIPNSETYVTSYVFFMDCIINTSDDIAILQQHGIIENMLGSNEGVAILFNRLGRDFALDVKNHYLSDVFKEINRYYKTSCHKWWASLKRDHCRNPWVSLSVIAAIVLLGLTATQTFFSVYAYFRPP